MCNAVVLSQRDTRYLTLATFERFASSLAVEDIPICTLSGGEPTLAPELPLIIHRAAERFSEKVMLISNFYNRAPSFDNAMSAALLNNVHIVCSLDAVGHVADTMRGARGVSHLVLHNLRKVAAMRSSLGSTSQLEIHTVLGNDNVKDVKEILSISAALGITHTFAPLNAPAQLVKLPNDGRLTDVEAAESAVTAIKASPQVRQMHAYIDGIPAYASDTHSKECPYLTRTFRHVKVFLEPNGDISLCDRKPIGNLNTLSMGEILSGDSYEQFVQRAEACRGCWLSCFTEPALATHPLRWIDGLKHRAI